MRALSFGIFFIFVTADQVVAQCASGLQRRGDVCISQRMTEFIVCVEASGGNRQQVYERISSEINSDGTNKARATGSGVIISGSAALDLGRSSEEKIHKDVTSNWYGDAMSYCLKALAEVAPVATIPVLPPPAPPTINYRVCVGEYERACQPHEAYLYCYSDVRAWAAQRCASYSVSRYNTYGGNKCGYGMDMVICVGPK